LTFHDARHEATTRLAGKLQVLDLARVTGHRDIKQLMTYYNKDARELAELL
jgi:integrase